ncbi:iron chelate uptake ABC transporter family permease subunit, partial [Kocuria sp.]
MPSAIQQKRKRFVVRSVSPAVVTAGIGVLALVCIGLYLFLGLDSNAAYVLPRRANRVFTMVLVAFCVGVSTVLFQTVTSNRILTPSIMGFDSLFML